MALFVVSVKEMQQSSERQGRKIENVTFVGAAMEASQPGQHDTVNTSTV